MASNRTEAERRVLQDLRDIEEAKWAHIGLEPAQDNLSQIHVNIVPQQGALTPHVFHLVLTIPESFPDQPPAIEVMAPLQGITERDGKYFFDFPSEWSYSRRLADVLKYVDEFLCNYKGNNIPEVVEFTMGLSIPDHPHTYSSPVPRPPCKPREQDDGKTYVNNPSNEWQVAKATSGVGWGKVMYEARLDKVEASVEQNEYGQPSSICSCRFGWATADSEESAISGIFYGNGRNSHIVMRSKTQIHTFQELKPHETFKQGDVICAGIDFESKRAWFARNGKRVGNVEGYVLPDFLHDQTLYPVVGLQNSAVQLNFGEPKRLVPDTESFSTIDHHKILSKTDYLWNSHRQVKWNKLFLDQDFDSSLIFSWLSHRDLCTTATVCRDWNQKIKDSYLLQQSKLRCFVLRESHRECILGLGLVVGYQNGQITSVTSPCEYLSWTAWNSRGIRQGPSGGEFTHFLPLIINPNHAKKSVPILQDLFSTFMPNSDCQFNSQGILTVLSSLLSGTVSVLASDVEEPSSAQIQNQLELFSHLQHMFQYLNSEKNGKISALVDANYKRCADKTSQFLNRKNMFDLGSYYLAFSISAKYNWKKARKQVLLEVLDRGVPAAVARYPELRAPEDLTHAELLTKVMDCVTLSRRLIMLQTFFVAEVCQQNYDERFGFSNEGLKMRTTDQTSEIYQVNTWKRYFANLYLKEQEDDFVANLLMQSVSRARDKKYFASEEEVVEPAEPVVAQAQTDDNSLPMAPRQVGPKVCESFSDLVPPLAASLEGVEPMELQTKALPVITSGTEVTVVAPLGSGKHTLAAITVVNKLITSPRTAQVLVIVPERNHAIHFEEILADIYLAVPEHEMVGSRKVPLNVCICAAKEPYPPREGFRNRTCFVGTIGRVNEMLITGQIQVDNLQAVYIMEGDILMSSKDKNRVYDCFRGNGQGFDGIHQGVQVLFFSSIWTNSIAECLQMITGDEAVNINLTDEDAYKKFSHYYVACIHDSKKLAVFELLSRMLEYDQAVAYVANDTRSTQFCDELTQIGKVTVGHLHKRMNAEERRNVVAAFNEGNIKLLITEDTSLYGLKTNKVSAVIHVDTPSSYGGQDNAATDSYHRRLSNFVCSEKEQVKSICFSIRHRPVESFLHEVQNTYGSLEELPDDPNSV